MTAAASPGPGRVGTGPRARAGWWRLFWFVLAWSAGGIAAAQTLDDVNVRSQSDARVVRIRFNASVRLLEQVPTTAAELYTIRFEIISADEGVLRQTTDEFRRLAATSDLPGLTITYHPDPGKRMQQLTVQLAEAAQFLARQGANVRSLELVFRVAPAPGAAAPPVRRYTVLLETLPLAQKDQAQPIPPELQAHEVIGTETVVDGVPSFQVSVGFFATREEAEAQRASVIGSFPQARVVDLAEAPAPPGAPVIDTAAARPDTAATVDANQAETERIAGELMGNAREAMAAHRSEVAIALLNQLLKLPPNAQTQEAQEMIGLAWEEAGSPSRARIEYSLYLKLYPQGGGAERVTQRMQALGVAPPPAPTATAPAPAAGAVAVAAEPVRSVAGSIAQYYYGGKAKSQSLVNIATGIDQATLTRTTESSIVTSLDLSGRYTSEGNDTRAVVRSSGSINLLDTSNSSRVVSAAYLDHRRGPDGLAVRIGRQSPISGGLLGLFDGVSLVYPIRSGVRIDVMGGVPANTLISAPNEKLFATVVETDGLFDRWGGNAYLLVQTTEGITNRQAIGSEVRYAGDQWSLNALIDYDVMFRALNALSLHGSFQAGEQTTLTLLVDDRRAPSLQLSNALLSTGASSLSELLQTKSMDQIRAEALATSATARQYLISASRPLDPKWQAAVDLRYSAIGALPAVGDFEATSASGSQYTLSAQLTGTNLYSTRDINNFNLSVTKTPYFKGVQLSYNNVTGMAENHVLTVEPALRLYAQQDEQDVRMLRVGPGVRLTYKATARTSLLAEVLFEVARLNGPTSSDNTQSGFFYVGYRYELF
jgi:hypothetical protein